MAGLIHTTNLCRRKELDPSHPTFIVGGPNDNSARASIILGWTQPFPLSPEDNLGYPDGGQLAYRCGESPPLCKCHLLFEQQGLIAKCIKRETVQMLLDLQVNALSSPQE